MAKSVLIIGEDPKYLTFPIPGAPPDMTADKILTGLREAHDRLANAGYDVRVILTKDEHTVEGQVFEALKDKSYDVIVVGAGLRILPTMAAQFERLMNVLHQQAPTAKLAFNSMPDDSDAAALRWL